MIHILNICQQTPAVPTYLGHPALTSAVRLVWLPRAMYFTGDGVSDILHTPGVWRAMGTTRTQFHGSYA